MLKLPCDTAPEKQCDPLLLLLHLGRYPERKACPEVRMSPGDSPVACVTPPPPSRGDFGVSHFPLSGNLKRTAVENLVVKVLSGPNLMG